MTRWKRERVTVVREMLEHHRWSRWGHAVIAAAEELCSGLCAEQWERYRACDGDDYSRRVWIVPAALLERVGGMDAVQARAEAMIAEQDAAYERMAAEAARCAGEG